MERKVRGGRKERGREESERGGMGERGGRGEGEKIDSREKDPESMHILPLLQHMW